jgi:hypothetical protein
LQKVRFSWRIQFVKNETETFLFFIEIPLGKWVMLNATASIGILGAWSLEPADQLTPENVRRLARFPTFLKVNPSDDFANTYKPPGADTSQTIFFTLGADGRNILAVTNPDQGKKALLRYSPNGVPGVPPKKGYPLAAFVDLSWTLRDWLASGLPLASSVAVREPGAQQTPAQQVLTRFVEAYAQCSNVLRAGGSPLSADASAPQPLQQRFRVADYSVSMSIALAKDGSIAERSQDETSRLEVSLSAVSGNPTVATVALGAPDFIVSGLLYGQIFDALGNFLQVKRLASLLRKDPAVLISFCASARPHSAIFKMGKDHGSDQLLLVLSGEMQGFPELMVVRANFDGIFGDFLDAWEFAGDPSTTIVDYGQTGQWFFPLISKIRFWMNELLTW